MNTFTRLYSILTQKKVIKKSVLGLLTIFSAPLSVVSQAQAKPCAPVYGQSAPVSLEAYINGGGLSINGARCEILSPSDSSSAHLPFCVKTPEAYCDEQLDEILKTRSALMSLLKKDQGLPEYLLSGVVMDPAIQSPEIRFVDKKEERLKVVIYLPFPGSELRKGKLKDSDSGPTFIKNVIQSPETLPDQIQNLLANKITSDLLLLTNQTLMLTSKCSTCQVEAKRLAAEAKKGLLPHVALKEVRERLASTEELARLTAERSAPLSARKYRFFNIDGDFLSFGGVTINMKKCLIADRIEISACTNDMMTMIKTLEGLKSTLSPSDSEAFMAEFLQFGFDMERAAERIKRRELGINDSQGVLVSYSQDSQIAVRNYHSYDFPFPNCTNPGANGFTTTTFMQSAYNSNMAIRARCTMKPGQSIADIRAAFQKLSDEKSAMSVIQIVDSDGKPVELSEDEGDGSFLTTIGSRSDNSDEDSDSESEDSDALEEEVVTPFDY